MTRTDKIASRRFHGLQLLTKKDVKMRVKMGTVVPKMGTFVHLVEEPTDYRTAIAMALHEELDDTHRAIKMAMRWTGASERTV